MNKTILITGGAIRIGKAICKKFHKAGFNILCHYNSSKKYVINCISVDSPVSMYAKNTIIPISSKTVVFDKSTERNILSLFFVT